MESVILKKLSIGRAKVGTQTSLHVILSERCTILNISADHSTDTLENAKEHILTNVHMHTDERRCVLEDGHRQMSSYHTLTCVLHRLVGFLVYFMCCVVCMQRTDT